MKFTIVERVTLIKILPANESYLTHKIITDFKNAIYLSEEEIKNYEYKEVDVGDGRIRIDWNLEKAKEKEVDVGVGLKVIICSVLKTLDEEKKINEENSSLYEKFILK